jgi:hypothetical protein
MKKLLLALLFTIPFQVLLAQNAKVIPASMNSSAKHEATVDYNPPAPTLKTDSVSENSDKKNKNVKCVPGCSGKKQCVKKTSSTKNAPANTEEKTAQTSK